MASQKFQRARLAGRSGRALASDCGNKAGGGRQRSTSISTENKWDMIIPSTVEMRGVEGYCHTGKGHFFSEMQMVRCSQSNLFFRKNEKTLLSDDKLLKNDIKVAR